jgi:hypothetical protein
VIIGRNVDNARNIWPTKGCQPLSTLPAAMCCCGFFSR